MANRQGCVLWGVLSLVGAAALAEGQVRISAADEPFRLLAPNQQTQFEVRLLDAEGGAVAGHEVLFVAPQRTEAGAWSGHEENKPWLMRATTDGEGRARAEWTAGERPGPYILTAMADGYGGQVHFAVTNVEAAPEVAIGPDGLRSQWLEKLELKDSAAVVHGPFFLAPNTEIWGNTFALQGEEFYFSSPDAHWLLWIDEHPDSRYGHAGRFVLIHAGSGEGLVAAQNWYPTLRWPNAEAQTTLYRPDLAARDLLPDPDDPPKESVTVVRLAGPPERLAVKADPEACAIVVYGSDEHGMRRDVAKMVALLKDEVQIPESHIFTNKDENGDPAPAKPSDIDRLVAEMCKAGCSKVYVYISSHGSAGTIKLANESDKDGVTDSDAMTYEYIGTRIRDCGASTNVQFILDACASGTAIRDLHVLGLDGNIFAGAGLNGETKYNYWGGYFTRGLIDAWRADDADLNGDGVDLQEAFDYLRKNGSGNALFGQPMASPIYATVPQLVAPAIFIEDPANTAQNAVTVTIQRPVGSIGLLRGSISIPDDGGGVANVVGGTMPLLRAFTIPEGQDSAQATIRGVGPGVTTYTVRLGDQQEKRYRGEAVVVVGAGFSIKPSNASIDAGGSATFTIVRDPLVAQAEGRVAIDLDPSDSASGDVADPDLQVVLEAGETEKTFQVKTWRAGVANITATQRGTRRKLSFTVTAIGLSSSPEPAKVGTGATVDIVLRRFGLTGASALTITPEAGAAAIATLTPGNPSFADGQAAIVLVAKGVTAGTARYTVSDAEGHKTTLTIVVEARTAACLSRGVFDLNFTVTAGQGHAPFFNLSSAAINFAATGGQASLSSNHPNLPAATGTYSPACVFDGSGRATLVGMPAITFEYRRMVIDPGTGNVDGEYGAGLNGDLPGGYAIWYRFTGKLRAGTGQ